MKKRKINSYIDQGKYIFLYNIFERLTFFAFYISIARYVDKDLYGLVVSVSAFTNILASVFDLGLPFYIQRESATGRFDEKILSKVILFKFLSLTLLLPTPLLYFLNEQRLLLILLVSIVNFYHPLNQILVFFLNGKEKFKENFFSILYTRLILFTALFFYTIYRVRIEISLVTILLLLLVQTVYLIKKIENLNIINGISEFNFKEIIKVIKFSLPFGLGVIFTITYDRVDVLILKYFAGNIDVAIYSVAYSLYRHTSIFSTAILLQSYNKYSKFHSQGRKLNFRLVKDDFFLLVTITVVLIAVFQTLGDEIISLIYTNKFISSADYLKLISFAIPFIFLNNFTGILLNSYKLELITMFTTFLGLIINIVSNLILIPEYKILGAVYSTIVTEASIFLLQFFFLIKFVSRNF